MCTCTRSAARSEWPRAASSPRSSTTLAGVLVGAWHRPAWNQTCRAARLLRRQGRHRGLLATTWDSSVSRSRATELPYLQPGRAAEVLVGGEVVGWLGEVHPLVLDSFEVEGPVTAFRVGARAARSRGGRRQALHRRRRASRPSNSTSRSSSRKTSPPSASSSRSSRRVASFSSRCGCSTCIAAGVYPRARSPWRSNSPTARPTAR